VSQYRFLSDHSIGGQYYQAGTTAFTADVVGGTLPIGWVPSGNSEPLDGAALTAFYAAGPQDVGAVITRWVGISVNAPVTRWVSAAGGLFALTGLGAALPPKGYVAPAPGRGGLISNG
jgi:hypothetical protein